MTLLRDLVGTFWSLRNALSKWKAESGDEIILSELSLLVSGIVLTGNVSPKFTAGGLRTQLRIQVWL